MRKTRVIVAVFWLLVWQAAALAVGKPLLFASPVATCQALLELLPQADFWQAVAGSLGRIALGFFLAFVAGAVIGGIAWRFPLVKTLLSPALTFMKTVPVASFVILVLVWFGSGVLSIVVSFLIVFPQIYFAALAGLNAADAQLVEMARVFRFTPWRVFLDIYRPPLLHSLIAACSSALGMSWKSGIAAEVIGTPERSIGEALYLSKVYMMTSELFAWTLVIILLSAVFEKTVLFALRRAMPAAGVRN